MIPPGGPNGGNGNVPPEMLDACESLQTGDACTVSFNGMDIQGICTSVGNDQCACLPQGGDGVFPGGGAGGFPGGGAGGLPNGGGIIGNDANPVVVPCTVASEGKTWWYVGIRFKGNSSLMSTWSSGIYKLPPPTRISTRWEDDHPEIADQRFFGFEKLSLAANWSDPS